MPSRSQSWTVFELLKWTTDRFRTAGIADPRGVRRNAKVRQRRRCAGARVAEFHVWWSGLREAWKRQYSIGRTDKVHYCLAGGVVDFAAYGVVVRAGEALNGTSTEGDDEPWWWEERGDASSKRKPASGRKRWRRRRRGRSSL